MTPQECLKKAESLLNSADKLSYAFGKPDVTRTMVIVEIANSYIKLA